MTLDQFGRQDRQARVLRVCPTILDREVFAVDVASVIDTVANFTRHTRIAFKAMRVWRVKFATVSMTLATSRAKTSQSSIAGHISDPRLPGLAAELVQRQLPGSSPPDGVSAVAASRRPQQFQSCSLMASIRSNSALRWPDQPFGGNVTGVTASTTARSARSGLNCCTSSSRLPARSPYLVGATIRLPRPILERYAQPDSASEYESSAYHCPKRTRHSAARLPNLPDSRVEALIGHIDALVPVVKQHHHRRWLRNTPRHHVCAVRE